MNCNAVWATDAEIMGAASLLQTDIHVYSRVPTKTGVKYAWLRYPAGFKFSQKTNNGLYLQNLYNDHFDVVTDC